MRDVWWTNARRRAQRGAVGTGSVRSPRGCAVATGILAAALGSNAQRVDAHLDALAQHIIKRPDAS